MTSKLSPSVVHQSKDVFIPGPKNSSMEHSRLPVGTYLVGVGPMGYYCERVEDLKIPKKMYGTIIPRAARIVRTFMERPANTGVLLSGLRGSGKTLLSKSISKLLLEEGVPTILINQPFTGDAFAQFLSGLNTPFVGILDEFEKVYDAEDQEKLLTLLDGVHQQKSLMILTCNKQHKVDENFINRPSRIFYNLHYKGMEIDAIRELALDTLDDKKRVDEIAKLSSLFNDEMNFDMVQSAIEEVNRYPEQKMSELMEMMNLRPNNMASAFNYKATLQIAGKTYSDEGIYPRQPRVSIFAFANLRFLFREGFSDDERANGAGVLPKAKEKAVGVPATPTLDIPAGLSAEAEKAVRKALKKSRKAAAAAKDDEYELKYDQNRGGKLKDEYDDVWDEWNSDYSYREKKGNIKEAVFSHRQMKGSNPKEGTYTFVSDGGAVLTLTRVEVAGMETSDYYDLL